MVILKYFYRVQGVGLLNVVLDPRQALKFPLPFTLADTHNMVSCEYPFFQLPVFCHATGIA